MTSVGGADGDDAAEVEGDHAVGDRGEQRHVVLDDRAGSRRSCRGCAAAAGRAPRPRAGRCPTTARRAAARSGRWASTHARSTTRRLPVDSSRTYLSAKAPRPSTSMSSSTRSATFASESTTAGRCSAAASGSRTSTWRSQATAIVSRDGERREQPAVLERPAEARAGRGRRARGAVMSSPVEQHDAGVGGLEAGEHVEEGRLARAVGPEEAEDLAGRDLEATRRRSAAMPPKRFETSVAPPRRRSPRRRAARPSARAAVGGQRRCRRRPRGASPSRSVAPSRNTDGSTSGRSSSSRGRAVEADLALLHEVGGVGHGERDVHRLLDEDHRRALAP